jgi:broad specificity phosphatase PhoE
LYALLTISKKNLGCISIKQDDRLMEMNFGDWEKWDVIDLMSLIRGWLIL